MPYPHEATFTHTLDPPRGTEAPVDSSALVIEHYAIGRELTHGGLGRILIAADRRLNRRVALKVPLRVDAESACRFAREVRITSRLQHPSSASRRRSLTPMVRASSIVT